MYGKFVIYIGLSLSANVILLKDIKIKIRTKIKVCGWEEQTIVNKFH